MLICALLGLTACVKEVELGAIDGPDPSNIVGHYEILSAQVSGEKGTLVLELFADKTGYIVFNGSTNVYINKITYSLDENSITFYGGTMFNGTYQMSKKFVSSLELAKGNQTFDFSKTSQSLFSRMTENHWRLKRSSISDYINLDFNEDKTGLWLDHPSYKNQKSYTFSYTLDPSTGRLKMEFNDGTYSEYDYVCTTGWPVFMDLLLFREDNSKYKYQKFDYQSSK